MVICLGRSADVHIAQLMLLLPTISCSSNLAVNQDWFYLPGFTILVPDHPSSSRKVQEGGQETLVVVIVVVAVAVVVVFSPQTRLHFIKRKHFPSPRMTHSRQAMTKPSITSLTRRCLDSACIRQVNFVAAFIWGWGGRWCPIK